MDYVEARRFVTCVVYGAGLLQEPFWNSCIGSDMAQGAGVHLAGFSFLSFSFSRWRHQFHVITIILDIHVCVRVPFLVTLAWSFLLTGNLFWQYLPLLPVAGFGFGALCVWVYFEG